MTESCTPDPGPAGDLLERAKQTDGFFELDEAEYLASLVTCVSPHGSLLEVGSYRGRSTLFLLAAMGPAQRLFSVDSFRTAASYAGHSYPALLAHVGDPRHHVLPMQLREAHPQLRPIAFGLALIDADHSFRGASEDLALAVDLCRVGSLLLCHDVCDLFPGVQAVTQALVAAGVLEEHGRAGTLVAFRVAERPAWLLDPGVYRDTALPG